MTNSGLLSLALGLPLTICGCLLEVGEFDGDIEVGQVQQPITFSRCNTSVRTQLDGTKDASYQGNYSQSSYGRVSDNGTSFDAALKGPTPSWGRDYYQRAWFSPSITYGGMPSLTYRTRRCSQSGDCNGHNSQKIHHHFLKSTGNMSVSSPARRYVGFGFRMDSYSENSEDLGQIDGTPLVFQMWQGSPHRPPFAAHLVPKPNGGRDLIFIVRSNTVGDGSGTNSDNGKEIGRMSINPNQWYDIVLSLYPEPDEDSHRSGNVTVGIDHRTTGSSAWTKIKYYGKWSYNTTNPGCPYRNDCSKQDPNANVDFKMGLYKSTNSYTKHQVSFGNVKMATQWSYATPSYRCTDTY